jgi:N-methylhydantoinase A
VIEMVEIGAGGGSIARVDALKRVGVGPDSAGAAPGPACYGQGGDAPTVTDADLALGRIDPAAFAAGSLPLDTSAAVNAIDRAIGTPLKLSTQLAALAVSEVVDENMASAARVHAVERGKSLDERTLVAFGGAAPLHAARVAAKLGIKRVVVPSGAGVGSAIGMLGAPIAYEVAHTLYQRVAQLEPDKVNAQLEAMHAEARAVVEKSAGGVPLVEARTAYMRYIGQGHEIAVPLEARPLEHADRRRLHERFEQEYRAQFGRTIPDLEAEVLSWALSIRAPVALPARVPELTTWTTAVPSGERRVIDPESGASLQARVFRRSDLAPGARMKGVALIMEDETTTVVPTGFQATVNASGYLILERAQVGIEETPR